jgi:hypothetical protein
MTMHDLNDVQCECLYSQWVKPGDASEKLHIGPRQPRVCRFCGRSDSETLFRDGAHAIPAAFGNRKVFSNEECYDCNHRIGSKLENDLASFLAMPRALSRIAARNGAPKIRSAAKQQSYIQSRPQENHVYAYLPTDNEGIRVTDDDAGALHVSVDIPSHRPINVAKAIARMSLFFLDPKYPGFTQLRDWVCGKIDRYPVPLVVLHWPGTGYNAVGCSAHRFIELANRNVIRCEFFYSSYFIVVPLALDGLPLPDKLPILNYPEPIRQMMIDNTSTFLIQDDSMEPNGVAEASISYEHRTD